MTDDRLLSGIRILVVEDEMLVLMALEDLLADLGCTSIAVAGSLEKALALIAAEKFDLATLDVNLDGKNSYPIAEALVDAGVKFAFCTGYGEHGLSEAYASHPVLNKPYGSPQLVKVLSALLDRELEPSVKSKARL
ncbi:MAG TPA: response regulator [Sphingomicrobium sp.]|nr:response regulator [Sphingomicrobium sp.]